MKLGNGRILLAGLLNLQSNTRRLGVLKRLIKNIVNYLPFSSTINNFLSFALIFLIKPQFIQHSFLFRNHLSKITYKPFFYLHTQF